MLYTIYIYNGVLTREGRPIGFVGDGVDVEELNFDSDDAAVIYAAEKVAEMNNDSDVLADMTAVSSLEYLDSLDWADGSAICLYIKRGDIDVYGNYHSVVGMFNEDEFIEDGDIDECITEAIVDNPKINQFAELKLDISELEKEINNIKYETSKARNWEFSDKILAFLSEEDREVYNEIASEIDSIETEIDGLEKQYKSVETRWYRTGPYGDDVDFDTIVTILDKELKAELEPKVEALREKLSELYKEIASYKKKARDAYNIDADTRLAQSGLEDKKAQLATLKASKNKILMDISEDPDFHEVFDFIKSEYKNMEVVNVGISDIGIFADVQVSYEIEVEDDDFNDDGYLNSNWFDEEAEEDICSNLGIDNEGDNALFECEDSDSEFLLELIEAYASGEPTIKRHFTPGRMYMPNGDPGYPDEYEAEISGDLEGIGLIRVTKVK